MNPSLLDMTMILEYQPNVQRMKPYKGGRGEMKLIDSNKRTNAATNFTESAPFLRNHRAILIHRPVSAGLYELKSFGSHIAVKCFCGATFSGTHQLEFVNEPNEDEVVCNACEQRAIMRGMPSSEEIVGRHVHTGKMVLKMICSHEGREGV